MAFVIRPRTRKAAGRKVQGASVSDSRSRRANFFCRLRRKAYLCGSKVNHSGMTLKDIKRLREAEDRVEFKEAKRDFSFAGGAHADPRERRKCVLG